MIVRQLLQMVQKLDNRKLCPLFENRVLWATGRLDNRMHHILGTSRFAIISPKTKMAELIILHVNTSLLMWGLLKFHQGYGFLHKH